MEVVLCLFAKSTMKVKDKSGSQTISGSSAIWMTCSLKTVNLIVCHSRLLDLTSDVVWNFLLLDFAHRINELVKTGWA